MHDGVNFTRTACVIAVAKARDAFEPFLHQLGFRLAHIMRRLLPISMFLLQKEGRFLNGHDLFIKRIGATYHAFVEKTMRDCQQKCIEDLMSTTGVLRFPQCAAAFLLFSASAPSCPLPAPPLLCSVPRSVPPLPAQHSSRSPAEFVTWSLHSGNKAGLRSVLGGASAPSGVLLPGLRGCSRFSPCPQTSLVPQTCST